jgi:hypothetical protein
VWAGAIAGMLAVLGTMFSTNMTNLPDASSSAVEDTRTPGDQNTSGKGGGFEDITGESNQDEEPRSNSMVSNGINTADKTTGEGVETAGEDASKDKKEQTENPKFDKLNCKFWIFGCTTMPDVKYEKVSGDLFVNGQTDSASIYPNDVKQGGIGDCYYLASIAAISNKNPDFIKNAVRQNPDGTYSVDFYRKKHWWEFWKPQYTKETVTVNDQFPVNKHGPVFAGYGDKAQNGNDEVWVMVMEKAYAKFRGSYNAISTGGWPSDAMEQITGKDSSTHGADSTSLEQLAEWDKNGYAITAASKRSPADNNVVGNHAYYIMDIDTEEGTVTMGNPWGFGHVTLTEDEFKKNYSQVYINPVEKN